MTVQNKTQGQQFLEILGAAHDDKNKMFTLLRSTLEKVNPFPTEKVNFQKIVSSITDMESVASLKASRAGYNASHGAYMFAEDYIYLTAKAFKDQKLGDIKTFKHEFGKFTRDENPLIVRRSAERND